MVTCRAWAWGGAVELWLHGQKLDGMAIYGLPTVWWSRAAKVATYLAGLTVVLDIVGPERLKQFGQRINRRPRFRFLTRAAPYVGMIAFGYLVQSDLRPGERTAEKSTSALAGVAFPILSAIALLLAPLLLQPGGSLSECDRAT